MATVTPVPFALGLLLALLAFGGLLWLLVLESRRPYHWPEPRPVGTPVEIAPRHHLRLVHPGEEVPHGRRFGNTRLAVVVATFLLWSLWSTGRTDRVDPHH
jgi:hypothetical protein